MPFTAIHDRVVVESVVLVVYEGAGARSVSVSLVDQLKLFVHVQQLLAVAGKLLLADGVKLDLAEWRRGLFRLQRGRGLVRRRGWLH